MWKTLVIAAVIILVLMLFPRHSKREVIFTKLAPDPIGQYSQAIKTGHHLFVSGQIALNKDGVLDTGSIENESRQVLNNIKAIIEAADMKMNQISKASIFLTDLRNFKQVNEVYKTYFTEAPPARETIEVKALPKGARVEISVIAED